MIFLANPTNLNKRMLLTWIHNQLRTQVSDEDSPIEQVWYQTSTGHKVGVRATITPDAFLRTSSPADEAERQVSVDFPQTHSYDLYVIQWVKSDRDLMVGWHKDETHMDLGECHFQIDHQGRTVRRAAAEFLDIHPLNVLDRRLDDLVAVLDALRWEDGVPEPPTEAIR